MLLAVQDLVLARTEIRSRIKSRDVTIRRHEGGGDLKVHYPIFSGTANDPAVNAALTRFIWERIHHLEPGKTSGKEEEELLGCSYQILLETQDIVSVLFELEDQAHIGSGRALKQNACFNFSPKQARLIRLSDLFRHDVDYLDILSVLATSHFLNKSEDYEVGDLTDNLSPSEEHFQNFCLTPVGIQFYFDVGQLGPAALGEESLIIQYSVVHDTLSTEKIFFPIDLGNRPVAPARIGTVSELGKIAIAAYTRRIQKQPESVGAYLERAKWYRRLNNITSSEADLRIASKLQHPDENQAVEEPHPPRNNSYTFVLGFLFTMALVGLLILWWKKSRRGKIV
jgi:Protein of unknown function (DUF3298)